jgi:hypothetical protein
MRSLLIYLKQVTACLAVFLEEAISCVLFYFDCPICNFLPASINGFGAPISGALALPG